MKKKGWMVGVLMLMSLAFCGLCASYPVSYATTEQLVNTVQMTIGGTTTDVVTVYAQGVVNNNYTKDSVSFRVVQKAISGFGVYTISTSGYTCKLYRNDAAHQVFESRTTSNTNRETIYTANLTEEGIYRFELSYTLSGSYGLNGGKVVTFEFIYDKTLPTYTLQAGGINLSNGAYTNEVIIYNAQDANFDRIEYVRPNGTTGYTQNTMYTVPALDENNGWWRFTARDKSQNQTNRVQVYLDTIAPQGKVTAAGQTVANGGYTNKVFSYSAADDGGVKSYEYKVPGSDKWEYYTSGKIIDGEEGWYTFRSTDMAGNVSEEYRVCYDATPAYGELWGDSFIITNGGYSNAQNLILNIVEEVSGIELSQVLKPGASSPVDYESGTALTQEGKYVFTVRDRAQNVSTYEITIDRTLPSCQVKNGDGAVVANGGYTNKPGIRFEATDAGSGIAQMYVKLPGAPDYQTYSGNVFQEEGEYEFYCTDRAQNRSPTYCVTLDLEAPVLTLFDKTGPAQNGGMTAADFVAMTATDSVSGIKSCYVKRPGTENFEAYSGAELFEEGYYEFFAEDFAGNISETVNILLDLTAPEVRIYAGASQVESGTVSKASYVRFDATDTLSDIAKLYVKTPGDSDFAEYQLGTQFTKEGEYQFFAEDKVSLESKIQVIVLDRTAPQVRVLSESGEVNGAFISSDYLTLDIADANAVHLYVKAPGESAYREAELGTEFREEGQYSWYAEDAAGNRSETLDVILDRTPAEVKIFAGGVLAEDGSYTNLEGVSFLAEDKFSGVQEIYVKRPGRQDFERYIAETVYYSDGEYLCFALDQCGNRSKEVRIWLDRENPSGRLELDGTPVENGTQANGKELRFEGIDNGSGIAELCVMLPGADQYTDYNGEVLTAEGNYRFIAWDRSLNRSVEYIITLDRTSPNGTLTIGSDTAVTGTYTNQAFSYMAEDGGTGVVRLEIKRPGREWESYTAGFQIVPGEQNGEYQFRSYDGVENVSEILVIYFDTEAPQGHIFADEVEITDRYTRADRVCYEVEDFALAESYIRFPNTDDFTLYTPGTIYSEPGKYEFFSVDRSGNESEIQTIIIDRSSKSVALENILEGIAKDDVVVHWTDGDIDSFAPIVTVTVNGVEIPNGTKLYVVDSGKYRVEVRDAANNVWKTEFIAEVRNVLTQTLNKEWWETKNSEGKLMAFSSHENALIAAAERELLSVRTAEWANAEWDAGIPMDTEDAINAAQGTYYIYKREGDPKSEVAYFTEKRLKEVILGYAEESISHYYYWQKSPEEIAPGNSLYERSDRREILAPVIELSDNVDWVIDETPFTESVYMVEGKHIAVVSDLYGNSCEYTFIVVRRAPSLWYAVGNGEFIEREPGKTYYLKYPVKVKIFDELDDSAMFYMDGKIMEQGEELSITESGKYEIRAVNRFGETETLVLYISLQEPKIDFEQDTTQKRLTVQIKPSGDLGAEIQVIRIYKDNGKSWVMLLTDDYGREIQAGTLRYEFRTDGLYRVLVEDAFRSGAVGIEKSYTYQQPKPEWTLKGVEPGGITNQDVSLLWSDEVTVRLVRDSQEIEYLSGQAITEEGNYELTIEDLNGFMEMIRFTIDKTPPAITIEGVESGGIVNTDVRVIGEEEGLIARVVLNGEERNYSLGEVLSKDGEYLLEVLDSAGNNTAVQFTIDKQVDFDWESVNGGIVNDSVTFRANEKASIIVTFEGEPLPYEFGQKLTEEGRYAVVLEDELGNRAEVSFWILRTPKQSFSYETANEVRLLEVLKDGEVLELSSNRIIDFASDGLYLVTISDEKKECTFEISVDATPPEAVLAGVENGGSTKGRVQIEGLSENATFTVFLNGTQIKYALGEELFELGEYRVVLRDLAGNETVYLFEIVYALNAGSIVLIVFGILIAVAVVVAIIFGKRSAFKKKKGAGVQGGEVKKKTPSAQGKQNKKGGKGQTKG